MPCNCNKVHLKPSPKGSTEKENAFRCDRCGSAWNYNPKTKKWRKVS